MHDDELQRWLLAYADEGGRPRRPVPNAAEIRRRARSATRRTVATVLIMFVVLTGGIAAWLNPTSPDNRQTVGHPATTTLQPASTSPESSTMTTTTAATTTVSATTSTVRVTTSTSAVPGGLDPQGRTSGPIRISPASGPPGTGIIVTPVHRCTPPAGVDRPGIAAFLAERGQFAGSLAWNTIANGDVRIGADGRWTATVRVPAGTKPGRYGVGAQCWDPREAARDDHPYFMYDITTFTVR